MHKISSKYTTDLWPLHLRYVVTSFINLVNTFGATDNPYGNAVNLYVHNSFELVLEIENGETFGSREQSV